MPTLEFKGKQHIYAHHLTVPYRPLLPDETRSCNPSGVEDNLIIHGDNLHALKALLPRYAARVKCIYIDPPYNTGNEDWIYNDNVNSPLMREWLQANGPVDHEDLERHDKWLCMMWPRLHLLKELLTEDGVIFVSIDNNEQHHLRMMMDEVFGGACFKNEIVVRRGTKNVQSQFETIDALATGHDSILLYSRDANLGLQKLMSVGTDTSPGKWDTFWRRTDRPTMRYRLFDIHPMQGQWRWAEDRAQKAKTNFEIYKSQFESEYSLDEYIGLIKQEEGRELDFVRLGPGDTVQYYVSPRNYTILSDVWMDVRTAGRFTDFPYEKHVDLIGRIIRWTTSRDDIILDSFAGSGTTAHAVLAVNREDGGNRRFILVECEDYADRITAERVARVIRGVEGARDPKLCDGLGGSFTFATLGEPIELEGMLSGDNLPPFAALAAYLLYTASGISTESDDLRPQNGVGLFHSTDKLNFHLFYEPKLQYLESNDAVLNEERAKLISAAARAQNRKAVVFAAAKYIGQRELTNWGITFCQLPYELSCRVE